MSWSSAFIDQLAAGTKSPQWELVVERSVLGASGTAYTSHDGLVAGAPSLISRAPTVSPNRVQPISWAATGAAWSVEIAWDDCTRAIQMCPRGSIVSLYCTLAGSRERVALGIVRNITGTVQAWRIECQTLTSGLTSRLVTSTGADEIRLFHDIADGDTTLAAAYTAGDGTVQLADASGLNKDSDTGGKYLILVTPTTGSPFYLTATGRSGNNLTGVSGTGQYGTTAVNALLGDTVTAGALIQGHPLDIARKLLISASGSATWDTLPDSWGLRLDGSWFAHGDINAIRDNVVVVSSGSYSWDVFVTAPIENPWAWLSALLSQAGIWMTMWQGDITFRAACVPSSPPLGSMGTIGRRSLSYGPSPSWSWQYQAQEWQSEYIWVEVNGATSTTTRPSIVALLGIESYPVSHTYTYDISTVAWSNEVYLRTDVADRLYAHCLLMPEAFTMTLRGWAAAQWCEGDWITLDLAEDLRGRRTAGGDDYGGVQAMLLEIAPDFNADTTRVRLVVYPQEA